MGHAAPLGPGHLGGPGAEATPPKPHSSHRLFPPLDRAEGRPMTGTCRNHAGGSAHDRHMTCVPATRGLLLTKHTLLCKAREPPVVSICDTKKKKRFQSDPKKTSNPLLTNSLIRILFVKMLSRKVPVWETGQPGVGLLPRVFRPALLQTLTPALPPSSPHASRLLTEPTLVSPLTAHPTAVHPPKTAAYGLFTASLPEAGHGFESALLNKPWAPGITGARGKRFSLHIC